MSAGPRALSRTAALLLRRIDHGESDLVVHLYTERLGRISALARGARRSQRRFAGALEPLHELTVALEAGRGSDLHQLREAALSRPRSHLASDLARMQAAATALGWLRKGTEGGHPEPVVWELSSALLDALDAEGAVDADALLARS
ncbi:MAG: DNA repair protein RecO, partial [Deltaproteobacteria bacterium]|nr:DNA repair protein RecO [Deltaproteobacteria bacterium]